MKTKMFLVGSIIVVALNAKAQTWDEWFRQKQTKLKYIEQQIAAFQMYAGYLKKGYEIAGNGWNVVDDIKHGDFDLHNNYFNSLNQVSATVTNYNKVSSITTLQLQVLQVNNAIDKMVVDNDNIQQQEKEYITAVMSDLLNKCADNISQLTTLVTNDSLSMKENERLQHIDALFMDMQDKYSFSKHFQNNIQALILARKKELNDAVTSKILHEIK